jgi:RimJ/RimL family protein N-acetyltransferase
MKQLVTNQKGRVGDWVAKQVNRQSSWGAQDSFQAIGLEENGELIAGMVVEGYVKNARCVVHLAGVGKRWLNREYLFSCCDYMFNQMGCKVVIGLVDVDNEKAMKFDIHFGFVEVARIKDGAGDCDLVILELRKENCRWLARG